MPTRHSDPDLDRLWNEFHAAVNMTGNELRSWLLAEASGETALPADPDPGLPEPGRQIVDILNKRKVDLTGTDRETMELVVARVRELRADPPPNGPADPGWRHELMDHGHDPLREPPERGMA